MEGRVRFQIVVDVLVDAPGLEQTCEELGLPLQEALRELTVHFLAEGIPGHEALEYRLISGPELYVGPGELGDL